MSRRAAVLGGGIAGLSAAIALRDAGYAVAVYEQAPAIEPLGAAISLWPNAVHALRRLGAATLLEADAAPIRTVRLAARDDRAIIGPWTVDADRYGAPALLPSRALVQRALIEALGPAVPVHLGQRAVAVEDTGEAARMTFDDGETITADLIVAADGLWSATASALLGNPPRPRGYGGVLALSDPVEPALDGVATEWWGDGERFGVFDLGGGRCYWFWMASEPHAEPTRAALLGKARDWPAPLAALIAATPAERLIPVTIAARAVPRRLGRGRIVCVGDAAHGMEPNLGQGACMALEDAVVLGAIAARTPPEAIAARFTDARRRRVAAMMRRAREGGLAAHGARPTRMLMRTGLRLMPAALHRRMIDGQYRFAMADPEVAA